jgi:FAD/FMN-containing dehydrogenase
MTGGGCQVAGRDGGYLSLDPGQLDELASRAGGALLRPGDGRWAGAVRLWNGMASSVPALVAQPATAAEVAAVVEFARDRRLLLSVKGGGHHIAGVSLAEGGLVLDLSRMREVAVDPAERLVRVGPGCQLAEVDRATQQYGLATVLGFISEVGAAGLILGGGLGYLTRRFGWSVDNLVEVEIVTADGEIRTASQHQNPDLFWAVRGAGANLGVVTRLTLQLHEVGPTVYGGLIGWPFDRADEILPAYRRLTEQAPRELTVWLVLLRAPAAPFVPEQWHGQRICAMVVCYSGDLAGADRALAPIRSLGDPVVDLLGEQPYVELQSMLDATEPKGDHYYWRTDYHAGLDDRMLDTFRDLFAECPMPDGDLGILHLGGALNERAADDGAVGNRDARYVTGVKGRWLPDAAEADAYQQWVRDAGARIRPFSTGATYINFQTADEGQESVAASYGGNLDRLVQIKRKYDPENLFRMNRSVAGDLAR